MTNSRTTISSVRNTGGTEAPCTLYEKKTLTGPAGGRVPGLYATWITLNNPRQYNSFTTEMVKGVIASLPAASSDRSVVAVAFTGTGDKAFCTCGNTVEYSEYYARRPNEYGACMDLFNAIVDAILQPQEALDLPGQRAEGQEIGMVCEIQFETGRLRPNPPHRSPLSMAFKLPPTPEYSKANRDHKRNPKPRRKEPGT